MRIINQNRSHQLLEQKFKSSTKNMDENLKKNREDQSLKISKITESNSESN